MTRYARYLRALPQTLFLPASLLLASSPASAACSLVPGPGNDAFTCDSGTSGSLTDLAGNNSLTLPANGTGLINELVIHPATSLPALPGTSDALLLLALVLDKVLVF
jgi:hypothetical protein